MRDSCKCVSKCDVNLTLLNKTKVCKGSSRTISFKLVQPSATAYHVEILLQISKPRKAKTIVSVLDTKKFLLFWNCFFWNWFIIIDLRYFTRRSPFKTFYFSVSKSVSVEPCLQNWNSIGRLWIRNRICNSLSLDV